MSTLPTPPVDGMPVGLASAAASAREALLQVEGLGKVFRKEVSWWDRLRPWAHGRESGDVRALQDVSFAVAPGETLGVLGESGSGKSTLARILMGLTIPDAGQATLAGEPLFAADSGLRQRQRRRMQMVFQDPFGSLDPRMSVRRVLAEPLAVHRALPRREWEGKLVAALAEVGLEPEALDRYPGEFSGGQRQRIGICRALMLDPLLLVADEAVSALDVSVQAQILELLMRLKAGRGLAMIFISHDVAVVRQVSDRILVLYRGRVVELLPADCLTADPSHPYTRHLVAAALLLREGESALCGSQTALSTGPGSGTDVALGAFVGEAPTDPVPPLREIHPGHWAAI
jgi:ABC-type glutathione transport system ATPase component